MHGDVAASRHSEPKIFYNCTKIEIARDLAQMIDSKITTMRLQALGWCAPHHPVEKVMKSDFVLKPTFARREENQLMG